MVPKGYLGYGHFLTFCKKFRMLRKKLFQLLVASAARKDLVLLCRTYIIWFRKKYSIKFFGKKNQMVLSAHTT